MKRLTKLVLILSLSLTCMTTPSQAGIEDVPIIGEAYSLLVLALLFAAVSPTTDEDFPLATKLSCALSSCKKSPRKSG